MEVWKYETNNFKDFVSWSSILYYFSVCAISVFVKHSRIIFVLSSMQSVAALVFIMDNRYYHVCRADWHLINFRVDNP